MEILNEKESSKEQIMQHANQFCIPKRLQMIHWRKALNLTQDQVRTKLGFCIRRYEAGSNDITVNKLIHLTDFYKIKSFEL